jgi:Leucine Rich repeat
LSTVTIEEHVTEFAGKPVVDWDPQVGLTDPEGTIYRVGLSYDEAEGGQRWTDKLAGLLADPAVGRLGGLVVGYWDILGQEGTSAPVVEALVAARDRLPQLRAIFFGDIIREEHEISWIVQSDLSPLFNAYPLLEHCCVRGGEGLTLGALRLDQLRSLVIQTGGLDGRVVREVGGARLPALEHLELWLGTAEYGGTTTLEDLAPILSGTPFPRLRTLALRDSQIADEIAAALASAPVLERIRVLDLSLGTLGDAGAAALLASPAVARLERLDVHHHYCSDEMIARLEGLGIPVDVSDPQEEDISDGTAYRYVAVSE